MANYVIQPCGTFTTLEQIIVDEGSNSLNIGDIWSFSDQLGKSFCGEVLSTSDKLSSFSAITQYTDCFDCVQSFNASIIFADCSAVVYYQVNAVDFGFIPTFKQTFNLDIQTPRPLNVCAYFFNIDYRNSATTIFNGATGYTNCTLCKLGNSFVNVVARSCDLATDYVVSIPASAGPVISLIDPLSLDEICATIVEITEDLPTATYLASHGDCTRCFSNAGVKREVISCIDGTIQVIYASTLYDVGETGYVQIANPLEGNSSCYSIGDFTENPITITTFLQYEPSVSCDECIACNGYYFDYKVCNTEEIITGATYSSQYISTGQTFFHPLSGCCEVINYGVTGTESLLSFYEFNNNCDSNECLNSVDNYDIWYVLRCNYEDIYGWVVTPAGLYNAGDIVVVKNGIYDDFCVELLNTDQPLDSKYYFISTASGIAYENCNTCTDSQIIGLNIVKCGTSTITKVIMTLNNYDLIVNNAINGFPIFTLQNYECYFLLDECEKDNSFPLVTPQTFYSNCDICNQPLSAGTESTICIICCDCGATGSTITQVSPPHPMYSNGYNKDILQMGMVTIGGNGLNN